MAPLGRDADYFFAWRITCDKKVLILILYDFLASLSLQPSWHSSQRGRMKTAIVTAKLSGIRHVPDVAGGSRRSMTNRPIRRLAASQKAGHMLL